MCGSRRWINIVTRLDGVELFDPLYQMEPAPGMRRHTELDLAPSAEAEAYDNAQRAKTLRSLAGDVARARLRIAKRERRNRLARERRRRK